MAGSIFNRVKTWLASEDVNASDLNAEFNNILNNLDTEGLGGYGDNTAEFQAQTDPGEVGSESLPSSLADELERLRYSIAELKGTTYWYTSPVTTLASLNTAFGDGGLPQTRLASGATTGNSSQSVLLTPEGAGVGNNLVIQGTPTTLVYYISGTEYTLTTDVTIASTTAAPVANNTALVNDAAYNDQSWTKFTGLYGTAIPIDNIGSEITSLNGKLAAFRITNSGTESEYFLGIPDTTNNQIKDIKRGWFYDQNGASIKPVVFSNNDTITLMNIAYVFLSSAGTASVTYNEPTVGPTQPSTPTNGDFWYDTANSIWKTYDGISFNDSLSVFVGIGIVDENGNCVGARSEDFVKTYIPGNTSILRLESNTQVKSNRGARVGVFGATLSFYNDDITWDITTDLDTGTESASTMYFFYLTENGTPKISIQAPIDFTNSRGGFYHPHETWRCLGQGWNNASSNLEKVISYHTADQSVAIADSSVSGNALTLEYWSSPLVKYQMYSGDDTLAKEISFPIYQDITVPSGATLGWVNSPGTAADTHMDNVVLHSVANSDCVLLGVSSHQWGQNHLVTTTALGTASDSGLLYTLNAYTDVKARAIAYGRGELATAGTWGTNLTYFMASENVNICRVLVGTPVSNYSNSTGTATQAAILSTFAVTGARKWKLYLDSAGTGSASDARVSCLDSADATAEIFLYFKVNSNFHRSFSASINSGSGAASSITFPVSTIQSIFSPDEAGTTGVLPMELFGASTADVTDALNVFNFCLVAEELPYDGDL